MRLRAPVCVVSVWRARAGRVQTIFYLFFPQEDLPCGIVSELGNYPAASATWRCGNFSFLEYVLGSGGEWSCRRRRPPSTRLRLFTALEG